MSAPRRGDDEPASSPRNGDARPGDWLAEITRQKDPFERPTRDPNRKAAEPERSLFGRLVAFCASRLRTR